MSDQPTDTLRKADPTKVAKYRAWLSATALLVAAIFGTLALGTFSAGEGLAGETDAGQMDRVLTTFNILGVVLIGFAATALFLAWRFRPGGD